MRAGAPSPLDRLDYISAVVLVQTIILGAGSLASAGMALCLWPIVCGYYYFNNREDVKRLVKGRFGKN